MYNITDACKEAIAQEFREDAWAGMTVYNIDMAVQGALSLQSSDSFQGTSPEMVLSVRANEPRKMATLELDYMRADGQYGFDPPSCYMSTNVSDADPDSEGLYPINTTGMRFIGDDGSGVVPPWTDQSKPLTIITDGSIARLTVEFERADSTVGPGGEELEPIIKVCDVDGDRAVITDMPADTAAFYSITIRATHMRYPRRRARIHQILLGDVEVYDGEITDLSYKDINDTVMQILPQQTMQVTVRNILGLTPEAEREDPWYTSLYTQARVQIGYGVRGGMEWIPTGRWFLSSYAVDKDTVTFNWIDALAVINTGDFCWSIGGQTFAQSVDDVAVGPTPTSGQHIRSVGERYDVGVDRQYMAHDLDMVSNPCPIVTEAAALQLLANASGNRIRITRTDNAVDLSMEDMASGQYDYTISDHELYASPAVDAEDKLREIVVTTHRRGGETTSKTLGEGIPLGTVPTLLTAPGLLASVSVNAAAGINYRQYGYAAYLWASPPAASTMVLSKVAETVDVDVPIGVGPVGSTIKLDNPLVDGAVVTAADYAGRAYSVLRYGLVYSLSHRGYPHLDAGDRIKLEIDGTTVPVLITENTITYKGGAMRGTAKARRLL